MGRLAYLTMTTTWWQKQQELADAREERDWAKADAERHREARDRCREAYDHAIRTANHYRQALERYAPHIIADLDREQENDYP